MIRIATIGTIFISHWFCQAAKKCDGLVLKAVYSREEEKGKAFGSQYGIDKIFTDLNQMADWEEIDAVYIANPTSLHGVQVRLMLEHGKHVLCEKPSVTNTRQLQELLKLPESRGLVFLEAMRPAFPLL